MGNLLMSACGMLANGRLHGSSIQDICFQLNILCLPPTYSKKKKKKERRNPGQIEVNKMLRDEEGRTFRCH